MGSALVVTGGFLGTTTFGAGEPNETILTPDMEEGGIFIARYNPNGTLQWAKMTDVGGGAITTLSDDSTVVKGGHITDAGTGIIAEIDFTLARYNPNGALQWTKHRGGASLDPRFYAITALSDNSTVVTGQFYGIATFGQGEPNETILTSDSQKDDIYISRYNSDGILHWAKRIGGKDFMAVIDITTLSDDSTVVTGVFRATSTFGEGEPNETTLTSAGGTDIFIARFAP